MTANAKRSKAAITKAASKAAKKDKQTKKLAQKSTKKLSVQCAVQEQDLLATLEEFTRKWQKDHLVTEDVLEQPPSRRANASLTPDPSQPCLWLFGGEFFNGTCASFYNDLYRYCPEKNEWRKFSSPTSPGPRSAHQMVATAAGGGKLWLFGGEFASPNQSTFHHYRDMWCFDLSSHSWEKIETKVQPSARSGHRMTTWKQWIILFGGFHDVGIQTHYLKDLWFFDMMEYKWYQVPAKEHDRWPSPRSGFTFLSTPEGIVLHGGYTKVYTTKTKSKGLALDDTFFLKLDASKPDWLKALKWEKRKRVGTMPSLRIGSTMVIWANKLMAVGFGGLIDVEESEESLVSEFFNDLYAYQLSGTGRWLSLKLKRPKMKKPKNSGNAKQSTNRALELSGAHEAPSVEEGQNSASDMELDEQDCLEEARLRVQQAIRDEIPKSKEKNAIPIHTDKQNNDRNECLEQIEMDDPDKTIPLARFNAMLAILKNTLYIYGGIYEAGDKEYTLQSFYSLALDKMDRYVCLRDDDIHDHEWYEESDSQSESESSTSCVSSRGEASDQEFEKTFATKSEDEREENHLPALSELGLTESIVEESNQVHDLSQRVEAFMGVSKCAERSAEEVMSTPLPGETLKLFYDRTREYWAQRAHATSQHRGKELRRDGFSHAEERYGQYKPILDEIERIQKEAGIDSKDVQHRAALTGSGTQDSRHRR